MVNKELTCQKRTDVEGKIPHKFSLPLGIEEHWCLTLMSFCILVPFIGWIAPIIFWIDGKSISAKINKQGKYIFNWFISGFLYSIILIFSIKANIIANANNIGEYIVATGKENVNILPMYFEKFFESPVIAIGGVLSLLIAILFALSILFPVIGTIKGYNRCTWKYPLSIPFIK